MNRQRVIQAIGVAMILALAGAAAVFAVRGGKLALVGKLEGQPVAAVSWVFAVSPDGRRVALQRDESKVALLDAEELATRATTELHPNRGPGGEFFGAAQFTRDGRSVLLCDTTVIMRRQTWLVRWDLDRNEVARWSAVTAEVERFTLAPDGRTVAAARGSGNLIDLIDVANGAERHEANLFRVFPPQKVFHRVVGMAFTPDGKRLLSLQQTGVLATWSDSLALVSSFKIALDEPRGLALAADGRRALAWDGSGNLALFETGTWASVASRRFETSMFFSVEISPDPDEHLALVAAGDGAVHLLELESLREIAKIALPPPFQSAFAHFRPGSREILVSHGPGSVERWSYERVR